MSFLSLGPKEATLTFHVLKLLKRLSKLFFLPPFSLCWVRCEHICTVIFSPMDAHLGINLDQIDGLDAQA